VNREQTTETLRSIGEARRAWREANLTVNSDIFTLMQRMLHEAAVNQLSIEDVAAMTGFTIKRIREMMRNIGMDPRASRTLLAKRSATVLAENAVLMGIEPSEMDLMSPLAYLPMGKDMKRAIENKAVSQVHEVDEVSGNRDAEEDAEDIAHYSELAQRYHDLLAELGFCTRCADGSTMPCGECGAGL